MRYLLLFLVPFSLFAAIEPISSITAIDSHKLEENRVLAVFDIDDTLTILSEPAFQRPNFKLHHAEIFAQVMEPLSAEERAIAFTLPLLTSDSELIEIQTPEVIKNLQNKGVKTIALTAAMGGRIQGVLIEDRRISELNRVGIDFSSSFPDVQEAIYLNFPAPLVGSYPLFKNGTIFTNENDKGKVLIEFLRTLSWTPSLIIFVDDRIDHLLAVKNALTLFYPEIEFRGYHFQTDTIPYKEVNAENFREKWIESVELAKQ